MYFCSKGLHRVLFDQFRSFAVLIFGLLVPATLLVAEAPKFHGNGAAGTVIEINENSNVSGAVLSEDALTYIAHLITSYSNIKIIDRRGAVSSAEDGNEETKSNPYMYLMIKADTGADGEHVYTVECRVKDDLKKYDMAGFVRKNVSQKDVDTKQIFRVASQYMLQALHVILTPTARKEILSAD